MQGGAGIEPVEPAVETLAPGLDVGLDQRPLEPLDGLLEVRIGAFGAVAPATRKKSWAETDTRDGIAALGRSWAIREAT